MRYPLLFPNRHSYRFLRKYPFIHFAAPYPFISNGHSCKGGFSALFQGRLRPFFLYLFFPSFLLPDRDSDIDTSHTPFAGSSSDSIFHDAAYMVVKRYIVLAASTQTADTLSRLMFFPPTCRNGSGLVSVDGQVFHVSESAADCFASTFSRPLSI